MSKTISPPIEKSVGISEARQRLLLFCGLLFTTSLALFLFGIETPGTHVFDEFHYVPSAKQFIAWTKNQNWEHPPLGKMLMALGISIFGDGPIGWRFMSAIFGSLTLVGMFLWGTVLFSSISSGLWVAAVTLFNSLLYVQARIGMLDTFMMGFLAWALAAFTAAWDPGFPLERARSLLRASGVLFGLAISCKWFAFMPLVGCLGMVIIVRLLQTWGVSFGSITGTEPARPAGDWYSPELWRKISAFEWLIYLLVLPFTAYYITFIPLLLIESTQLGPLEFFPMQARMYDGQLRVVNSHPYMSEWKQWPLLSRPIWYAFEKTADGTGVHGVALIGNPLIMWSGLLALIAVFWEWVRHRSRDAMVILFCYAIFLGSWIAIPRKVSFYYYYYPAGMTLSLALALVFARGRGGGGRGSLVRNPWVGISFIAASFGVFAYFYPILAGLKLAPEAFRRWMWFTSWI